MSNNAYNEPGIVYLFTCFSAEETYGAQNLYCYTNLIEILMAIALIVFGVIIYYMRYKKHRNILRQSRKQTIILLMILNLIAYITYQWSYENAWLYFPESYLQYIFFCFTIYYFGRKSILLGMINMRMDLYDQDIDPIIQLKLSKLFCMGLILFFSLIYLMTYCQYFFQQSKDESSYNLCDAQFFNIVTTVGFFMQGLFILQVKQLSRQVDKNLKQQKLEQPMENLKLLIQKRQNSLWLLVIVCFIGSFTTFIQNIYFVIQNQQQSDYTCWYVNLPTQPLSENINALIGVSIKIIAFFLPYFITVKIFWYKDQTMEQPTSEQTDIEVYEIRLGNNTLHEQQQQQQSLETE